MRRSGSTGREAAKILAGAALAAAAGACANRQAPPGVDADSTAPAVAELVPERGAGVDGFDGEARIEFDEPLRDPRALTRELFGSPAWEYRVEPARRGVSVRPEADWRPDVVYWFRLPPGIRDLVGNATDRPVELLFSTGGAVPDTRVQGSVLDRVSLRPVRDALVLVLGGDSIPYAAPSDTGGRFVLPGVPPGSYTAYGFVDQNRNRALDRPFEPHDSVALRVREGADERETVQLWLVPPDSTPPVLTAASPLDSLRVRAEFDEPLDPEAPRDVVTIEIEGAPPGTPRPLEAWWIGPEPPTAEEPEPQEPAAARAAREEPEDAGPGPVSRPAPASFLTIRLAAPLDSGTYRIRIDKVTNLRGFRGGGDTTFVWTPPRRVEPAGPRPDREDPDAAAEPRNARPGEEGGAVGDEGGAPPPSGREEDGTDG